MENAYQEYKNKLNKVFRRYHSKSAVVFLNGDDSKTTLLYSDLLKRMAKVKSLLCYAEINHSDRIAIISPHTPYAVVLNLALAYLGYTAVLIDASLPDEEVNKFVSYADISAVFTTEKIYGILAKQWINKIPVFEICNNFTYHLLNSPIGVKKKVLVPNHADVIAIIFSSGTTGSMKGVEITYSSIISACKYMIKYTNLNSNASFLDVLPSNHIAGYSAAMSCFLTGAELGFVSDVSAQSLSQGFLEYNPTNFIMIPKVYEIIKDKINSEIDKKPFMIKWYAHNAMRLCGKVRQLTGIKLRFLTKPIWKAAMGKNMKICGCGTAPCSEDVISFYLNLGIDFVNVYGSTETGFPITAANCNDKYPLTGTGNVYQFPDIQIIIHNPDSNGIGEIYVKTPLIMKGYFREPELTASAFDENGYFKTGDCGFIDKKGNLHITGRIKEAILLHSGKKVSPSDVDDYYLSRVSEYDIASRGIPNEKKQYDEIHLFVADGDFSTSKRKEVKVLFENISRKAPSMYKLAGIHFVPQIPRTSVGKVKRFCLKIQDETIAKTVKQISSVSDDFSNISVTVYNCIRGLQEMKSDLKITDDMRLKEDIGMDSLNIFEMCVELDEKYGVSIESRLHDNITISEIVKIIEKGNIVHTEVNDVSDYPLKKTDNDYIIFDRFIKLSKFIWKFEVSGLENINADENYIFCPNHESHFDGMWVIGNLDDKIKRSICSIAADYLFEHKIFRSGLVALGGIPVHRSGNTTTAMKRAYECLDSGNYSLLIHPEGTRTRSGKLGQFKLGAAELSIKSGVKIIPVCINGAYEIFPPDRKLPRLLDWKHFCKYPLKIQFGTPIEPDGKNATEITEEIKRQIVNMKMEKTK